MTAPARADVCVVGAGAAGMTVAHALRDAGLSVVVVDSGPVDDSAPLDEGEIAGLPYNGLVHGRRRGLGGTTTVWPGQCMRLRPEDLARWPVDIARWYDDAERLLGLVPGETARDPWQLFGEPGPQFDPSRLIAAIGILAPARDLSRLDTGSASILLRTTATAVAEGRVEVRRPDGTRTEIEADEIVLSAGTHETTRLLLASGFRHEALGRFFQDHAACYPATIAGASARAFQDRYGMRFRDGRTYIPKLLLAPDASMPGCMASIVFDYPAESAVQAGLRVRRALRERRVPGGRDVLRSIAGAPQVAAAAARVARGREPAPRPDAVRVLAVLEQRSESALTLAETLDPFGMPRLRVDWRLGDAEHRSLRAFVAALDAELRRTAAGRLDIAEWMGSESWTDAVFDVFHPAGTTRMGADGVVDPDCRIHGAPRIGVCSASVFPASGCVNPTLTIVALALRHAGRLRSA